MSSIPASSQNANPLLYTLRNYNVGIQPYWVIITQFFVFEISLRTWDRVVYGTWQLPIEYAIEEFDGKKKPFVGGREPRRYSDPVPPSNGYTVSTVFVVQPWFTKRAQVTTETKPKPKPKVPKLDLFDLIFSVLPLFGHTIWFCVIQSSCLSADSATVWNCYNIFGYRLYNYIFDRYVSFANNFITKLYIMRKYKKFRREHRIVHEKTWKTTLRRIVQSITLSISSVTFLFSGALLLPYMLTNAIPMILAYAFLVIIYTYLVTVVVFFHERFTYAKAYIRNHRKPISSKSLSDEIYKKRKLAFSAGMRLLPTLITFIFNLSQYIYFGQGYWQSLQADAESREPSDYNSRVAQSPDQIAHTILSTL
ncbi:unnamed protein product [Adineta steineri]|uniref:Uncharacterized protein n=1 Tax=Adineta steineri TaxID=433720 RepID=A0A815C2I4_9BILA|nr:unnamed protein product [Adineta steineri]